MGKWKEKPSVCRKQLIPAQSWTSCYVLKRQKEMMRTVLGPAGLIFQLLPFRFSCVQELKYKPVLFEFCSQEEC